VEKLPYQAIGHQLPEVFNCQVIHSIVGLHRIELAVAAMARHHHHIGAGGADLIHFTAGVVNPLISKAGDQGAATAATADLVVRCWIEINPLFYTPS